MSYVETQPRYFDPGPVAYADEPYEPVPGWGMRPNMAGPRRVGVGGLGEAGAASVSLVPPPVPGGSWKLPQQATAATLQAMWKQGSVALDVPVFDAAVSCGGVGDVVAGRCAARKAALTILRGWLSNWAAQETAAAAAQSYSMAAAYAYAQALLWKSFAGTAEAMAYVAFPNGGAEATRAAQRGDDYVNAGRHLPPRATVVLGAKSPAAWQALVNLPSQQATAPPPSAPVVTRPALEVASVKAAASSTGLLAAAGVAAVLALGGLAWWASKGSGYKANRRRKPYRENASGPFFVAPLPPDADARTEHDLAELEMLEWEIKEFPRHWRAYAYPDVVLRQKKAEYAKLYRKLFGVGP